MVKPNENPSEVIIQDEQDARERTEIMAPCDHCGHGAMEHADPANGCMECWVKGCGCSTFSDGHGERRPRDAIVDGVAERIASWLEKQADLWAAPEQVDNHELSSRYGSRAIRIAAARVRAGEWKK